MKPRRLKDGRLVVPVLEAGGMLDGSKDVMSIGLQVLSPQDPAFSTWQNFITGVVTDPIPDEDPEPEMSEDEQEVQDTPEDVPTEKSEENLSIQAEIDLIKADKHTGVILALKIPNDVGNQLLDSVKNAGLQEYAETTDDLHITILYLGDSSEISEHKDYLISLLHEWERLSLVDTIDGVVSGYGRFNNDEGESLNALYASVDSIGLLELRNSLLYVVEDAGITINFTHGFTPHITLAYVPESVDIVGLKIPKADLSFTSVTLAWGDEHISIPLGSIK